MQGYTKKSLSETIGVIGFCVEVSECFFYVSSTLTSKEALKQMRLVFEEGDSIIVIDATNSTASWCNIPQRVASKFGSCWENLIH